MFEPASHPQTVAEFSPPAMPPQSLPNEAASAPRPRQAGRRTSRVFDWLDDRTDYRRALKVLFGRELPDGPRWGYTTARCLFWLFVVQVVTGLLLMATYSPSLTTAWASVHFIDRDASGAFLRGLHHFAAQAMIVLFFVHVIRVLVTRAFCAPRELVWITGLLLLPLVLVWAVTGNPLSGTQRGLAQIDVEGNILGSTPLIGRQLQALLIGGDQVGNLTFTHLYFLHVALLPLLAGGLLAVHIWQVYRQGLSGEAPAGSVSTRLPYWPHQTVRNMVVLAVVLGVVTVLAWRRGAPLEMPADPEVEHMPRPEWYFLALFELRRYFTGDWEIIATGVIPVAGLAFLVALPLIDRACSRRASACLRGGLVLAGCGAWVWLTLSSVVRDHRDAEYQASETRLAVLSARARTLADAQGVPVEGAAALLRNDPKAQGPRLFARHCANCHSHADPEGNGIVAAEPSAPNLHRFASREWIGGALDPHRVASAGYFGRTKVSAGDMVSYVRSTFDSAQDADEQAAVRERMKIVAIALSAEAARPDQREADNADRRLVAEGTRLMTKELGCVDCHRFHDEGALGSAPELTGYGSREWLLGMIGDPNHEQFYGGDRNDRMPAFHAEPDATGHNLLSRRELELLVDWLRGDWHESAPREEP